ncbi:MAG: hypothetical protein HFJ36_04625 [Clostridia bacterium]|nr:hypothetical protein [Clostridia bacterium]
MKKQNRGITLIVLVITIIVLLILAGVTISILTGENGILTKAQTAKQTGNEKTATEIINLKITNVQIDSYSKTQKMPTLQVLADAFCEDEEIEYVKRKEKEIASLEPVKILSDDDTILTKLKEYPYQFEIDGKLRLASIDGVKVSETPDSKLEERLEKLETMVGNLQTENQELKNKVVTLENETIVNKRVKLTQDNFTPIEVALPLGQANQYYGSILLKEEITSYKYIEMQIEVKNPNENQYWGNKTVLIALDSLKYFDTNILSYEKDSSFTLISDWTGSVCAAVACYLKNEKEIVIGSAGTTNGTQGILIIKEVYGIK